MAQQSRTRKGAYRTTVDFSPEEVDDAIGRGDFQFALQKLIEKVRKESSNPKNHLAIGDLYLKMGRVQDAETAFHIAINLDSDSVQAGVGLVQVLMAKGRLDEAETLARTFLNRFPENLPLGQLLSQILFDLERTEEGVSHLKSVIASHPNALVPLNFLAKRLTDLGQFEDSRKCFEKALSIDPACSFAHLGWVQAKVVSSDDLPIVQTIESALTNYKLRDSDRMLTLFALGKALGDLNEFERSMSFYYEANEIRDRSSNKKQPFQKELFYSYFELTREIFTAEKMEERKVSYESTPTPLFICGMARSGTTLVEQILSSHSSVTAGGEIQYWLNLAAACFDLKKRTFDFERAMALRKPYQQHLRSISNGKKYVTDKLPGNYRILGLLRVLYPDAKFIHCRRNPLDTCLSIYMTPFNTPPNFASDPEKLVFTYKLYRETMEHWQGALGPGAIHEVCYEDLVESSDTQIRDLLNFCGLNCEDACLTPERNSRPIHTASMWQARQPIYRTSKEKWRRYEPWLGEFRQLV